MNSGANADKTKVFETLLSSPGMTAKCKINLSVSRQNIILISRLIEFGVGAEKNGIENPIISALPKETWADLKIVQQEILTKADIVDFYGRLKSL
ncbi:MAG: hypothetical protein ABIN74_04965 [Ferruginibacter sp.]